MWCGETPAFSRSSPRARYEPPSGSWPGRWHRVVSTRHRESTHGKETHGKERCVMAAGTKEDPWVLKTPPGTSSYTMYTDEQVLVCQVGSTTLKYQLRAVDDVHDGCARQADWVPLGAAERGKPAAGGTVEAWGRSEDNPVGGWYGLRKG